MPSRPTWSRGLPGCLGPPEGVGPASCPGGNPRPAPAPTAPARLHHRAAREPQRRSDSARRAGAARHPRLRCGPGRRGHLPRPGPVGRISHSGPARSGTSALRARPGIGPHPCAPGVQPASLRRTGADRSLGGASREGTQNRFHRPTRSAAACPATASPST